MVIQINEQYQITTDAYQWIIQRKRRRNGKNEWQADTYHPTFKCALQVLGERMVRASKANTLEDAIADVIKITTQLSQALAVDVDRVCAKRNKRKEGTS